MSFFGGVAEGIESGRENVRKNALLAVEQEGLGLRRDALAQTGAIAERTATIQEKELGLRNKALQNQISQQVKADVDNAIANTTNIAVKAIEAMRAGGKTPEEMRKVVTPLLAEVQSLGSRVGRKPELYANQFEALLAGPTPEETATTTGRAQAAQQKAATEGGVPLLKPEQKVQVENTLRDDFTKQSAPFVQVRDAYTRIQSVGDDDKTGASDVALLYGYMKMLDPIGSVREGEIATAQNAAGVPGSVMNLYNSVIKGAKLTPEVRNAFRTQAQSLFKTAEKQHEGRRNTFLGIAQRQGVDPRNVVIDLSPPRQGGGMDIPPPPDGFTQVR